MEREEGGGEEEGYTGLAITIGAVVTLFVAMQATGRIHWGEVLARDRPA